MPDGSENLSLSIAESLREFASAEWDHCAGDSNPFLSYAFLSALEDSGSVSAKNGWLQRHLLLKDVSDRLRGAVPLYLKSHSMGEYIFDYAWADAYERAGGRYYPKLVSAIPFTPVTGPRLLAAKDDPERDQVMQALASASAKMADAMGVSSLHFNFIEECDVPLFRETGYLIRHGRQYHWKNEGYGSFDDFLAALSSRKRKQIKKERRAVLNEGIEVRALSGSDLTADIWDAFYRFYVDTYDRKWGRPYLTRAFFDLISERMPDNVVLIMAFRGETPIAGALNLKGKETLYGRNWGACEDVPFLHFEACYYSAVEYAIMHGLKRVEAGTQGEHKIQRGYLPVTTYSAHWIADPGFRSAVARFLEHEREEMDASIEYLKDWSPFRHDD